MTYVAINVLTVPEGSRDTLEERFGARRGAVDTAPGFVSFELLRPVSGTDQYLVVTHWASRKDFEAWTQSQAFRSGHRDGQAEQRPAATGSQIWAFEVVQESRAGA